jgi:hypothetical protein
MAKKENINEGLIDLIKKAAASLKQGASQGWEKVQGALRSSVANLTGIIAKKSPELAKLKPQLQFIMDIKNEAEAETGEKFPVDNTMQIAQNLSLKAREATQEVNALKGQVASATNQSQPVAPNQRGVQEAFAIELTTIINETVGAFSSWPVLARGYVVLEPSRAYQPGLSLLDGNTLIPPAYPWGYFFILYLSGYMLTIYLVGYRFPL